MNRAGPNAKTPPIMKGWYREWTWHMPIRYWCQKPLSFVGHRTIAEVDRDLAWEAGRKL